MRRPSLDLASITVPIPFAACAASIILRKSNDLVGMGHMLAVANAVGGCRERSREGRGIGIRSASSSVGTVEVLANLSLGL